MRKESVPTPIPQPTQARLSSGHGPQQYHDFDFDFATAHFPAKGSIINSWPIGLGSLQDLNRSPINRLSRPKQGISASYQEKERRNATRPVIADRSFPPHLTQLTNLSHTRQMILSPSGEPFSPTDRTDTIGHGASMSEPSPTLRESLKRSDVKVPTSTEDTWRDGLHAGFLTFSTGW